MQVWQLKGTRLRIHGLLAFFGHTLNLERICCKESECSIYGFLKIDKVHNLDSKCEL